jgi:hypothetical protein
MSRSPVVQSKVIQSKEQILSALRAAARKLRRAPTRAEFMRLSGIHYCRVVPHFRGFRAALRAAGLEPHPGGLRIDTAAMMEDWGRVARKVGRVPTRDQYERHGRYASASLETRFHRWSRVNSCFLEFVEAGGLSQGWGDVVEKIRFGPIPRRGGGKSWLRRQDRDIEASDHRDIEQGDTAITAILPPPLARMKRVTVAMLAVIMRDATGAGALLSFSRRVFPGRPVMGTPLLLPGLAHEPVNEMGVVFLFGMLAHRLGFLVESMQMGFPDCEAKREVEPGRWQRLRIEFEYESRKFRDHHHDPRECDVIVCWTHNWPGCPQSLEVLELSRVITCLRLRQEC